MGNMNAGGIRTKPTRRGLVRFEYFAQCEDTKRLPAIPQAIDGYSAAECFHVNETYGVMLPCREPTLLSRALNGKEWHGLTVMMCAEDYVARLLFADDLKANYPDWVIRDIIGNASRIAVKTIGFIPTFVRTGEDATTLETIQWEK